MQLSDYKVIENRELLLFSFDSVTYLNQTVIEYGCNPTPSIPSTTKASGTAFRPML
jgi:hypothetical protein